MWQNHSGKNGKFSLFCSIVAQSSRDHAQSSGFKPTGPLNRPESVHHLRPTRPTRPPTTGVALAAPANRSAPRSGIEGRGTTVFSVTQRATQQWSCRCATSPYPIFTPFLHPKSHSQHYQTMQMYNYSTFSPSPNKHTIILASTANIPTNLLYFLNLLPRLFILQPYLHTNFTTPKITPSTLQHHANVQLLNLFTLSKPSYNHPCIYS